MLSATKMICSSHSTCGGGVAPPVVHGHNWTITAKVRARELTESGHVLEPGLLDRLLWEVLEPIDHRHLNDLPVFAAPPGPTVAVVARHIGERLRERLPAEAGVLLSAIEVSIGPGLACTWSPPREA